jgi:seryl-tRNA synthetase
MELGTVLAEHQFSQPPLGGEVMAEAEKQGWIKRFNKGQFIYTRPWVELFRLLQGMILNRAINDLQFEEWMFPRIIPREALDSFKLTQFAKELLLQADPNGNTFLDPVQCVPLYYYLRGSELNSQSLPIKIVECLGGWTWRNEPEERLDGPYRAMEFARIEHIYIGTPAQVRQIRRAVQSGLTSLLTDIGLSWHLVVGKGCMDVPSVLRAQKEAVTADDIPVQDIEVPIRGALKDDGRDPNFKYASHYKLVDRTLYLRKNDSLYLDADEICGCSVEGDHLVRDFNIRCSDGQEPWSGCCGIGINRLVVAFLYQHGFNRANWPDLMSKMKSTKTN